MSTNYTTEQHRAIHHDQTNLIVIAGAGSGKTRVLVDRFVALLEANPSWPLSSLVAITFTEKAAREMRDRVRQTIEDRIATCEDGQRPFWQRHQAALDGARISTIHGLCAEIVRANAAYAGVDPDFTILADADSAILRKEALDLTMEALPSTGCLALFTAYGEPHIVRKALSDQLTTRWEPPMPIVESLLAGWTAEYTVHAAKCLEKLRSDEAFHAALDWQPSRLPPTTDKLAEAWYHAQRFRTHILEITAETLKDELGSLIVGILLRGGTEANWGGQKEQAKSSLELIRDFAKDLLKELGEPPAESDRDVANMIVLWAQAVQQAQSIYRKLKQRQAALDFDDLEQMARDLLQIDEVQARYRGVEFQHVMVDEFQDTNAAQRDIMYALTGLERPNSLFVVGDPKQSIYAFRGAQVAVFERVRAEIVTSGGVEIPLAQSFRAHRGLIDGLNSIFAALMGAQTYGVPMTADRLTEAHHGPIIEVTRLDKKHMDDDDEQGVAAVRIWEAALLAERIKELIAAEYPVWSRAAQAYQPVSYGDFAVLVQVRAHMLPIEDAFKAAEVPYVTVAGTGYYDRPEVQDLLNLLRALYNPADGLSLASALRSPLFGVSDDGLYALRLHGPDAPYWECLMTIPLEALPEWDVEAVSFARDVLTKLQGVAGRVTIAELLSRALDETLFLATLTGLPNGGRRVNNVEKLLEVARQNAHLSLGDFMFYLNDLKENEQRESEAPIETEGAVQIMTVHAAKGLEFPIVALFDSSHTPRSNTKEAVAYDAELGPACCVRDADDKLADSYSMTALLRRDKERQSEERLRLFYVAATRAQDKLLISGGAAKKGSWLAPLCEVLGLSGDPVNEIDELKYEWGVLRYRVPHTPPAEDESASERMTAWDTLGAGIVVPPIAPPLLESLPVDLSAPARTLTATEIAALGEAHTQKPHGLARFRQMVLNDAPSVIRPVGEERTEDKVPRRVIGEIVHEALQWEHTEGDLERKLIAYAWEQGVTNPEQLGPVLDDAREMLLKTQQTHIAERIDAAYKIYRELPFSLRLGERTINGKIDVLFLDRQFGQWTVVDYKTDTVTNLSLENHARRYHMQVGIYAAAVEQLTGQAPSVLIHYVRTAQTVKVEESGWRAALASIDDNIAAALAGDGG